MDQIAVGCLGCALGVVLMTLCVRYYFVDAGFVGLLFYGQRPASIVFGTLWIFRIPVLSGNAMIILPTAVPRETGLGTLNVAGLGEFFQDGRTGPEEFHALLEAVRKCRARQSLDGDEAALLARWYSYTIARADGAE